MNGSGLVLGEDVRDGRRDKIGKVYGLFRVPSATGNILVMEGQFKRMGIGEKQRRLPI